MTDVPPVRSSSAIASEDFDREVVVQGWVQDVRNLGGISFLILRDHAGLVQIAAPKKKVPQEVYDIIVSLPRESVVRIRGVAKRSNQAKLGFEVVPTAIEVLSRAASPLPLGVVDKVGAETETRFNNRFMDLRKPETRAVFEIKSAILQMIDEYLESQGFTEVFTPKIVASGAEGGASLFEIRYFDRKAYLAQSPQLYKQILMSTGLDKVYEVAPAFRAEPSDTIRHVSEFISFDGEMAFISSQRDVMDVVEGCTKAVVEGVAGCCARQLEAIGLEVSVPRSPYPVLTYSEAVDILISEGMTVAEGEDIGTEGEKALGEVMRSRGFEIYWIIEYPEESKPFYIMEKEGTPYSHSFDLDYRGQEIASGGQREHRYDALLARMEKKALDASTFRFYLEAFRYGMPPHGGWGLGVERFVQALLGLQNIREAILFPRDRNRLAP